MFAGSSNYEKTIIFTNTYLQTQLRRRVLQCNTWKVLVKVYNAENANSPHVQCILNKIQTSNFRWYTAKQNETINTDVS